MPAKLKMEIKEYHLARGLFLWLLSALVVAYVMTAAFMKKYPAGCRSEFIIWVLNNYHVILALFPILLLAVTSGGQARAVRYPVLVRYRDRDEFFYIKAAVRTGFVLIALSAFVGMLLLAGRGMPVETQHAFIASEDHVGIALRQFLNILCFWSAMLILHEILHTIVGSTLLDLSVTTFLPLGNYIMAKKVMVRALEWTPWGKIGYKIEEIKGAPAEMVEKLGRYRFYWEYWMIVMLILFCLAKALNRKKDFVFEENYETC